MNAPFHTTQGGLHWRRQDRNEDESPATSPRSARNQAQILNTALALDRPISTSQTHTLNPQAPDFESRLRVPPHTESRHRFEHVKRQDPICPGGQRINARVMITDEITGEDIDLDLPIYISAAQQNFESGWKPPSRSSYEQGRSARIMENWRGGDHSQAKVARDDMTSGGDQHKSDGGSNEDVTRSGPWRRGKGISRGFVHRRGEGDRSDRHGERVQGELAMTGPESEWVQVRQKFGEEVDRVVDDNSMIEEAAEDAETETIDETWS